MNDDDDDETCVHRPWKHCTIVCIDTFSPCSLYSRLYEEKLYEWWITGPSYLSMCLSSTVHWRALWR